MDYSNALALLSARGRVRLLGLEHFAPDAIRGVIIAGGFDFE
jgi:hypothetical protein